MSMCARMLGLGCVFLGALGLTLSGCNSGSRSGSKAGAARGSTSAAASTAQPSSILYASPGSQPGLAASYSKDQGIQNHADVLFFEDFEAGDISQWNRASSSYQKYHSIVSDPTTPCGGQRTFQWTVPLGTTGGTVGHRFSAGVDVMHVRWYQKYEANYDQGYLHHSAAGMAACAPGISVPGNAGIRPTGADKFSSGFEPVLGNNPPPGELMLYTYHPDQKGIYGDNVFPATPFMVQRDRWYCFEFMIKANTPGSMDGEMACWVDGQLIDSFSGYRFRDVASLKLNKIWLGLYIHSISRPTRVPQVWYDNVVVAKSYIGPMAP